MVHGYLAIRCYELSLLVRSLKRVSLLRQKTPALGSRGSNNLQSIASLRESFKLTCKRFVQDPPKVIHDWRREN
jgi:hypothetical protein